jgi:hypothetical protein
MRSDSTIYVRDDILCCFIQLLLAQWSWSGEIVPPSQYVDELVWGQILRELDELRELPLVLIVVLRQITVVRHLKTPCEGKELMVEMPGIEPGC